MDTDILLAYSEWLDSMGLIVADDDDTSPDKRPHDQLVLDFKDHYEATHGPGSQGVHGERVDDGR